MYLQYSAVDTISDELNEWRVATFLQTEVGVTPDKESQVIPDPIKIDFVQTLNQMSSMVH